MKKLIYIAGTGHSGSTMLGLILGQHPRLLGLGEVYQVLQIESAHSGIDEIRRKNTLCSCGSPLDNCEFWKRVAATIAEKDGSEYGERLQVVLDTVGALYGNDRVPVDTSKGLDPLARALKQGIEVKVIHLIKDVRAYTVSYVDRARVRQSRGLSVSRKERGRLAEVYRRLPAYYFLDWHAQNRAIQEFLKTRNVPSFQLGYEELCLYPERMLKQLCEFLEIPMEEQMLTLGNVSSSHIIRGNRMRHSSEKRQIRYDNRWFYRSEWVLPSILFPHIMSYNRAEVYKNTARSFWEEKR
jgi:hypothetical protein